MYKTWQIYASTGEQSWQLWQHVFMLDYKNYLFLKRDYKYYLFLKMQ